MKIRPILKQDRESLAALLRRTDNFTSEEVEVALELIDDSIERSDSSGYHCLVALNENGPDGSDYLGYVCYGSTPMTTHTYDLYWIVVDSAHRGKHIGRQLLAAMEGDLQLIGGRIIRVETSSQESYQGTMKFYEKEGFLVAGRIPDFYKDGDDLLIYIKALS